MALNTALLKDHATAFKNKTWQGHVWKLRRRRAPLLNSVVRCTGEGLSVACNVLHIKTSDSQCRGAGILPPPPDALLWLARRVPFGSSAKEFFHHQGMAPQCHVRKFFFRRRVLMRQHHDLPVRLPRLSMPALTPSVSTTSYPRQTANKREDMEVLSCRRRALQTNIIRWHDHGSSNEET